MPKRAPRTQLNPEWQPSFEDWNAAGITLKGSGLLPVNEFKKFRDYHLAHASLMGSWSRAFRYWCRRAVEFAPQKPPDGSQGAPELTREAKAEARAWYLAHGMHVPMKL